MFPLLASAAVAQTAHDPAVWSSINTQVDLHPERTVGPRLWADFHFRRTDAWFVGIARPALGWDVAEGAGVFVGYAWVPWLGEATDDQLMNEHRVWEQLLLTRAAGRGQLGFRPRLEQRFVGGEPGVGHRLRLWGRGAAPLGDRVSLVVTDEVFVGLGATTWTTGSNVAGFDQNRLFVGPALPIEGLGRLEVGYLNVFLLRESGNTDLHALSSNLFATF
jgi:hypothetical protein